MNRDDRMDDYIIVTKRCGIREIADTDIAAEFELYGGPHMTDHIPPLSDLKYAGRAYPIAYW